MNGIGIITSPSLRAEYWDEQRSDPCY